MNPDKRIYVITHCRFTPPDDPLYSPLQAGHAIHPDLGYPGDDSGDNISSLNTSYCELTGIYWIWKNSTIPSDGITGVCHYRRYLLDDNGRLWNASALSADLKSHDIITTRQVVLDCSYRTGFGGRHNVADLDAAGEALRTLYPDHYADYDRLVNGNRTYFGNMMICRRHVFDSYCSWLFPILKETGRHVDISGYDGYARRLYGFLSEFLLFVWVEHNGLRVHECNVAVIGEKDETRAVRLKMTGLLNRRDINGAMDYLVSARDRRPDIFMEASDVDGSLKLLMQITASCCFELESGSTCMLDRTPDAAQLIPVFRKLNSLTADLIAGRGKDIYNDYIKVQSIPPAAQLTALRIFCRDDSDYRRLAGEYGLIK
jgi:hypothetical protein